MPGLVPRFISQKHRERISRGGFTGSVLIFDVSGFTSLTERLSYRGHQGAETLSEILNRIFSRKLMSRIREAGGFVSGFAGDSFTVIIPGADHAGAASAGADLMSLLTGSGGSTGAGEESRLTFRAGVSTGPVLWRITGSPLSTWFFIGKAMASACRAVSEAGPGELAADAGVRSSVPGGASSSLRFVRNSPATERTFFPELLVHGGRFGEFRRVFPVFISPKASICGSADELAGLVDGLIEEAARAGGYFEGVHFDEAGPYVLVLFGAPWSFENDGTRSVVFAGRVLDRYRGKLRIGISAGTVYTGIIGFHRRNTYTAIGNQVNTAARIMRFSDEPGVFVSGEVLKRVRGNTDALKTVELPLKGKSGRTRVARLESSFLETGFRRFRSELVGRDRELDAILEAALPILQGRFAGCVIVSGRPGAGKSHLVSRATDLLVEKGCMRRTLQCSDISDLGFEPFMPFLKEIFGQEEAAGRERNRELFRRHWMYLMERLPAGAEHPEAVEELERTVSMIQALLGIEEEDSLHRRLEARGRYENTLLALRALLTCLASLEPLVLVVEDYQWIDGSSADILEMLARSPGSIPLLIVLTCRLSDEGGIPHLKLREDGKRVIELESLEECMLPAFVRAVLGSPPGPGLLSFLSRWTSGIPLYIDQYLRYLLETGSLHMSGGAWTLTVRPEAVPHEISDILQARIDRMSPGLRELVQTASVLGYEFNTGILGRMHGRESIVPLLESGRNLMIWSALSSSRFVFKHALLRDAAYSMQLTAHLRRTHAAAAGAIEEMYPGAGSFLPDLARHCERAGDPVKACSYLERAAAVSEENYSLREALGYHEKLLALIDEHGCRSAGERVDTLLAKISVLSRMNLWDLGLEACGEAGSLAESLDDKRALGRVLIMKSWLKLRKGLPEDADELAGRAEAIFRGSDETGDYVRALGYRAATHFNRSDFRKAEELFLRKLDILESADLPVEKLKCLSNLGCVYKDKGENARAEEFFNRAAAMAEGTKRLDTLSLVLGNRGTLYRNMGLHRKAMRDLSRAIGITRRIGDRRGLSGQLGGLALLKYDMGRYREALELYRRQLEIAVDLDYSFGMAEAHGYMAACLEAMGRLDEALNHYDECIGIARSIQLNYYVGIFLVLKASMLFETGRTDEADAANREGLEICRRIGVGEMVTSGTLLDASIRISETQDPEVIRDNIRRMIELSDSVETAKERAEVSYRIWKTLRGLPPAISAEYDLESRRREALEKARKTGAGDRGHLKMVKELEAVGRDP